MAEVEIFKLFLLVMVRVSGLMVSAPVLGSGNIPVIAKIGLTAMIALLITPGLVHPTPEGGMPAGYIAISILALGELLIGLIMGFVMTLVFAAVQVGGQIMDMQSGFGMMNVFNPAMETQFPIFGFFLFIIAVLYLLVIDGHHTMLRALSHSYEVVPLGGLAVKPELFREASRWGTAMFVDGLMIAAPIATAMMLAYATMGILGRVVPQIHLFVVGFPVTIATGLFMTGFIIDVYLVMLGDSEKGMFGRMFQHVETLIHGLG